MSHQGRGPVRVPFIGARSGLGPQYIVFPVTAHQLCPRKAPVTIPETARYARHDRSDRPGVKERV
jgi:hypothetical protein